MTDRELMQQALEGLEAAYEGQIWLSHLPDLSTALRERLAQPEQEPTIKESSTVELVIDCPRCGHCCSQKDPMPLFDDWEKDWK